jgi:ABC-type sugar transport system permease subunit
MPKVQALKPGRVSAMQKTDWTFAYLFIAPFFILYLIFGFYPIIYSVYLSLCSWKGKAGTTFIGLGNYIRLVKDKVFWQALYNTVYILIIQVPVMTLLALIFAAVLNSKSIRFRKGFQLIYLLPYVTSSVAVSIVFIIIFDDSTGWVNQIIQMVHLPAVRWFRSETFSKITIMILITWQWVGYNMLIMIGGINSIPPELYEAAKIDGASSVRGFFSITAPLMMPVVLFTMIMSTIGTFNMFAEPKVLTQGGPGYSSTTVTLYLFNQTFMYFQLGYGAAMAFVLFVLIMLVSIPQIRASLRSNIY